MLFFFNDTATTEIYTLSLHDALPISRVVPDHAHPTVPPQRLPRRAHAWQRHHSGVRPRAAFPACGDRKSTRLNSSHSQISYAVFCLKKKTTGVALVCTAIVVFCTVLS